jgi:hypothetical protein
MKNKCTYADALLKNLKQSSDQHQSNSSIVKKKDKTIIKRNDEQDLIMSYIEPKPGSQYQNPRDKAGKNKVHNGR